MDNGIGQIIWAGGTTGLLAFMFWIIYAFLTERIVPRGRLDELKELLATAHGQSDKAADITESVIREQIRLAMIEEKLRSQDR